MGKAFLQINVNALGTVQMFTRLRAWERSGTDTVINCALDAPPGRAAARRRTRHGGGEGSGERGEAKVKRHL